MSIAGIKSLSCEKEISEIFSIQEVVPSAGKKVNHKETFYQAKVERDVLKILEGDCETPIGVHAEINDNEITLRAELFSLDGTQRFYEKKTSLIENFRLLGKEVGKLLKIKSNNSYKK